MLTDVKFSMPVWPGLNPDDLVNAANILKSCKNIVHDMYFTCRIQPFNTDAMGGFIVQEEKHLVIHNAMFLSKETGIPLSATFNNTKIHPGKENYNKFVKNFRPLYDHGIKTVTIPFTTWMRFGLKKEFPDLFVKNTIINRVTEAAEVAKLYDEGFDYINLDRNLIRNNDRLKEIKKAKIIMQDRLQKKLYLSMLVNEMCESYCMVQDEHYVHNFNRDEKTPSYFDSDMRETASCIIKNENSPSYILKAASIPAYYSQFEYFSDFIDVFKLHGRENKNVFLNSLDLVERFNKRKPLSDPYRLILNNLDEKSKKVYFKTITNCKFDCWKCNLCDSLHEKVKLLKKGKENVSI